MALGRPYMSMLHLSSVYGVKCLGEIYEQECQRKVFYANSYDATDCHKKMLWIAFSKIYFDSF